MDKFLTIANRLFKKLSCCSEQFVPIMINHLSMGSFKNILQVSVFIFLFGLGFSACNNDPEIYLVIGEKASTTEQLTTNQLKADIEKVSEFPVQIITANEDIPSHGKILLLGTRSTNQIIEELAQKESIILSEVFPGSRGGIWATVKRNKQKVVVLAGSDVQGMQYAVYNYCKEVLNIDPLAYWNGNTPDKNPGLDLFAFQNKVIPPPEIPILCYFENDVDELANIKSPKLEYDWTNYTEMINSLVRIKYNAIQLFDMLGRPEFFLRPEYQAIRPDYDIRISYIDSMIDYAHDMGMQVQIDMALGYKIKPMEQDKADCWAKNKQQWIDTWKYYFEETPIGKVDIFALRPRNQVWDWEYKSSCGESKIDVFNEVYEELGELIDHYKPGATKVALCYHDGMEMFNNGFNPPKDWIVAWSDNGWADFDYQPESTKGYNFGTYMHAGFWLNHTIHDPCPVKIDTIMKQMVNEFGANKYCMVNGQQFRPFILNIEAFSEMADNVDGFDGDVFYNDWAIRYFGEKASLYAVSAMKKLHQAQFNNVGYVQHLWEIREAISYLSNVPIERPGKSPICHDYRRVANDFEHVAQRAKLISEAINEAKKGEQFLNKNSIFYNDYILLPLEIYADLLAFEMELHQIAQLKKQFEDLADKDALAKAIERVTRARKLLEVVYNRRLEGDKNRNWNGWYNPENRRPNNGFPTLQMVDDIETNLNSLIK